MKIIKTIIKAIVKPILFVIFKIAWLFDKRKLCVVYVDGGLGSQINKLALGLNMQQHGYIVKYDLTPFRFNQKDINGIYNRNLDIVKIYKGAFKEASRLEVRYTQMANSYRAKDMFDYTESIYSLKTPVYLSEFIDNIAYWNNVSEELKKNCIFSERLSAQAQAMAEQIKKNEDSVVVHIRRGDYIGSVFDVTTLAYYNSAIHKYTEELKHPVFYFFSNEPDWVRNTFLPQLPDKIEAVIVDFNDNDSGYNDIALMNCAKNFVLSNSSFSIMGAFFSIYDKKRIVMPEIWFKERFGDLFDKNISEEEFILKSQKAHDITGETVFLPC